MERYGWRVLALGIVLVAALGRVEAAEYRPHVAIVLCEDSYVIDSFTAHSSGQALVGLAGLVGVPYTTVTLSELLTDPSPTYTSVWFGYCTQLSDWYVNALGNFLGAHIDRGGSVFLDGPLGRYDMAGVYRGMAASLPFLGIDDRGGAAVTGFSIRTTAANHVIAKRAGHAGGSKLAPWVRADMETVAPLDPDAPGSAVLLELVAPGQTESYPYLAVSEPGNGARVVAVGAYGTYHAAASPYLHDPPTGFFDNRVMPYLVEALLWALGPADQPFVGLQLSHAPMTVIGRLDGDWSGEEEASRRTLDYVVELGKQTGVATVYGIVSGFASDMDNWPVFRTYGPSLETLGGAIASHSHNHPFHMSQELDDAGWTTEVPNSLATIRAALRSDTWTPAVRAFINPGDTIGLGDYDRVLRDIDLYMTHGFEQLTPYSSGVMSFGLASTGATVPLRPVVNNTPVPDFIWLFTDEYVHTVAEAVAGQEEILDYYQKTVGRGVLYNQMWHDYAISDLDTERHDGGSPIEPMFDITGQYVATHRVYAPSVTELTGKLYIAHGVALTSQSNGDELVVDLDYTGVAATHLEELAGMGLRVNASNRPIGSVMVDGMPHHAFTSDTVILPAAKQTSQTVTIHFADAAEPGARLTYISKPFGQVTADSGGAGLQVVLAQPGLTTRFCLAAPRQTVILDASSYRRPGDAGASGSDEFCGLVAYEASTSRVIAQPFDTGDRVYIQASDRMITHAEFTGERVVLEIAPGSEGTIVFEAAVAPGAARFAGEPVAIDTTMDRFVVSIPESKKSASLELDLTAAPAPAGCGCIVSKDSSSPGPDALAMLVFLGFAVVTAARRGRTGHPARAK